MTKDRATDGTAAPLLSSLSPNNTDYGGVVETNGIGDDVNSDAGSSDSSDFEVHGTTPMEAFLNLLKGYFGAGMLSLPWALSQLGVVYGSLAVFVMAFWSSYNCWTVVKLKRFIERTQNYNSGPNNTIINNFETASAHSGIGGPSSISGGLETASVASSKTNLTFPDVGDWAYGNKFQSYVSVSMIICFDGFRPRRLGLFTLTPHAPFFISSLLTLNMTGLRLYSTIGYMYRLYQFYW